MPTDADLEGHRLDTVTDVLERLRHEGYRADLFATPDGRLACRGCGTTYDPAEVRVERTYRFEGDTNPDDQDIVLAIECGAGCRGVFTTAYGATTPADDAVVLRALARARPAHR